MTQLSSPSDPLADRSSRHAPRPAGISSRASGTAGAFEPKWARLPSPEAMRRRHALSAEARRRILCVRAEIAGLVHGRDPRLLVVVGPCSIHDPVAALEYADRLAPLAGALSSDLRVVMRAYLEKPRSSVGWKGLISDPHLDGSGDLRRGLDVGRRLLVSLAERGLPLATELLDLNLAAYFADLLCWAAIGARTAESQPHRELASEVEVPVGFKNGTDGSLEGALGGLLAASRPHVRVAPDASGRLCALSTRGNPNCHLTLRGGARGPNYDERSVTEASSRALAAGLSGRVLVDCSHGNSGKDHRRQAAVVEEVARQVESGSGRVLGVMLESHLVAGRQALATGRSALRHGQSITDACIDFEETERLLRRLAAARRAAAGGSTPSDPAPG